MTAEPKSIEGASGAAAEPFAAYAAARVLVTGGLGFIGSNLARRLAALGAEVLVLDNRLPGSGANAANLAGAEGRIAVVEADVRCAKALRPHLEGRHYLFNLAAQTSHQGSMEEPLPDLDINCRAQLQLLELCRAVNPEIGIVFASTRQIYGRPDYLPVDEAHPVRPPDVNGIAKAAGEAFHLLYHRVYGMRCTALRLTNTYGPRMRIKDARQTFLGVWLRALLEGRSFEVWGGAQTRDLTYVEDAVDAFLHAALSPALCGRAANVGGDGPVSLSALAEMLIAANGGGSFVIRDFPEARRRIDIGDYCADDRLLRRATGWRPRTSLADGLARSLAFFREHLQDYV
ncbi:MAG TPA: NAD-dependent epimerase/dehydratase family protein [Stellaceae bacterium]|nr:NAD-dependent epimerase/dehydratase family protein [Stellaceae bacterium]